MERITDERENSSSITTSPTTTTTSNNGALGQRQSPRSELNPYPVTFVQANAATFKQIVQMLTGSVTPASGGGQSMIRPIRTVQKKQGPPPPPFKLYERRKINNGLTISPPVLPYPTRNTLVERLSPSILDFPSLALSSPVTPLTGAQLYSSEEEKAIAEKGFYLHPSPRQIDGDEPRLLPLFPVTSPRLSFQSKT